MVGFVELFNWSAVMTSDRKSVCLRGTLMNHPKFPDYTYTEATSPVTYVYRSEGRFFAVTRSGTHYRLGLTDAKWLERHAEGRRDFINHFHLDVNVEALAGNSAYGELS